MLFRDKAFSLTDWPAPKANHKIGFFFYTVRHSSVEITVSAFFLAYWFSDDHNKRDLNFRHQPKVIGHCTLL